MGGRGRGTARPKNTKKTFGRIVSYMSEYRSKLVLTVLAILISAAANVAGTYFLRPIINDYIAPFIGQENVNLAPFIGIILAMLFIYVAGAFATWAYNRLMVDVSCGTLYKIRTDLFEHLEKLPIKYFDTNSNGDIMSRFTNDADAVRMMLSQSFSQVINSTVTVIGVFIMMLILSPLLTLLVLVFLGVMVIVTKFIGSKSSFFFKKQQAALGSTNGFIEEFIEGQKVVKVFCHEKEAKADFDKENNELADSAASANTFANILMPIMGNISNIQYVVIAIVGSLITIFSGNVDGGLLALSVGSLVAFLQYTRSFSNPITQISQQVNVILNALAGAERIFNVLDEEVEVDDGYVQMVNAVIDDETGHITEIAHRTGRWAWKHKHGDGTITYSEIKGDVEFNHVDFSYDGRKMVLKDLSLHAKPGQKIAFVGSTGAGKTTITNLINRFYDIADGKIRYDGININKIKKDDLRHTLSIVLQDTHLFTGTVMDNIRYGKLDATDEEVIRAAKLANAHWFITHLPNGYNTMLTSDGANLSQGQRQLIAIARAAVADPPVLILDEATSSIDTRTEALIEKGMDGLMKGRTVFVIAHRLSTVRNSDAIMVLEQGEIIERGSHDELIAQKGRYYQLYTGAFELS